MLYDRSNNAEKFIVYLRELKAKIGKKRIYLYMDNLKVHHAILVQPVYQELKITPIWAPAYSPEYNPIELYFNCLKRIVKKWRTGDMLKRRKRTYKELIPPAIQLISKDVVNSLIKHVMKLM